MSHRTFPTDSLEHEHKNVTERSLLFRAVRSKVDSLLIDIKLEKKLGRVVEEFGFETIVYSHWFDWVLKYLECPWFYSFIITIYTKLHGQSPDHLTDEFFENNITEQVLIRFLQQRECISERAVFVTHAKRFNDHLYPAELLELLNADYSRGILYVKPSVEKQNSTESEVVDDELPVEQISSPCSSDQSRVISDKSEIVEHHSGSLSIYQRSLGLFTDLKVRLLVYAPPHSGKTTFINTYNKSICDIHGADYYNSLSCVYSSQFIYDTDDIEKWSMFPFKVITNMPHLLTRADISVCILPDEKEFNSRLEKRGLDQKSSYYSDCLHYAVGATYLLRTNKYLSQVCAKPP